MGRTKTTLALVMVALVMPLAACGGSDSEGGGAKPAKDNAADRVAVIVKGKATAEDIVAGKYQPLDFATAAIQETCATKPAEPSKQVYAERWLNTVGYRAGEFSTNDSISPFMATAAAYVGDWQNELGRRNGRDPAIGENASHWDELCEIDDPIDSFLKWVPTHQSD